MSPVASRSAIRSWRTSISVLSAWIATGLDAAVSGWAYGAPADLRKGFAGLLADRQGLEGPRVQDVNRPAHVERLPEPARARRPRVQVKPSRLIPSSERLDWIVGHRWRRRNVRKRSSVGSPESQLAVGLSFHLVSLLVDRPMMAPAEHREVRERGGPALAQWRM